MKICLIITSSNANILYTIRKCICGRKSSHTYCNGNMDKNCCYFASLRLKNNIWLL